MRTIREKQPHEEYSKQMGSIERLAYERKCNLKKIQAFTDNLHAETEQKVIKLFNV